MAPGSSKPSGEPHPRRCQEEAVTKEPKAGEEEPRRLLFRLAKEQHVLLQAGGQRQLLHRLREEPHAQAAAYGVTGERL